MSSRYAQRLTPNGHSINRGPTPRHLRVILWEDGETVELGEDVYVDLDLNGNLVSMTIEHARTNAQLREFSYEEVFGEVDRARHTA